jgi:hypothetical protein
MPAGAAARLPDGGWMKVLMRYAALVVLLLSVGWFVSSPGWESVIVLIGAVVAFFVQDGRYSRKPNLAGRWEYLVVSANNRFSHKGDCHVRQDEAVLQIQGVRRYTCIAEGGRDIVKPVHIAWNSEWAQLCHDNVLRFEYVIALPDPKRGGQNIRAVCRLEIASHAPTSMNGKFYVLPPFDEKALNCNWGDITLTRIAPDEPLSPPPDYDPGGHPLPVPEKVVPAYHGEG